MSDTILSGKKKKVIRDKGFANRLEIACEGNPHCPTDEHRGKQKWVYENLQKRFGLKVSAEGVRKWFAGESRPRPRTMGKLAELLEVDEAWLSLGTRPDLTPKEKQVRNAVADGTVNVVTGLVQILGGHVAFPETADPGVDLYAIIEGRQREIAVKAALDSDDQETLRFTADKNIEGKIFVGVIMSANKMGFKLLRIPSELIKSAGKLRGGYYEFAVKKDGARYTLGDTNLKQVKQLRDFV